MLPEAKQPIEYSNNSIRVYNLNAEDKDDENNMTKPNYGVDIENIMDDPEIQEQNLSNLNKDRNSLLNK